MSSPAEIRAVLTEAQRRGLVGPGDVGTHLEHARGFLRALSSPTLDRAEGRHVGVTRVLDLGSGGGLPGLVLAWSRSDFEVVLLDINLRSTTFLDEAIGALGLSERVRVVRGRAEELGRDPSLRGSFDVVVSRGFGRPALTAECGAPFLHLDGRMVISEPPAGAGDSAGRWPTAALARLGLRPLGVHREKFSYQVLIQDRPCPDTYPRRTGVPAKRPLF